MCLRLEVDTCILKENVSPYLHFKR